MENTKLKEYLDAFQSAVLTGIDAQGYPVSIRCQPQLDSKTDILSIELPAELQMLAGTANLLYHAHDEKLWKLKNFALQGTLERQEERAFFHIERLLPGMNVAGAPGPLTTIMRGTRTMKRILQKRGLVQPAIPWERLKQLAEAQD